MSLPSERQLAPYVQAVLALMVIGAFIAFYAWFKWVPDALTAMASMAFGFYFGVSQRRSHGDPG